MVQTNRTKCLKIEQNLGETMTFYIKAFPLNVKMYIYIYKGFKNKHLKPL